MSIKTEPMFKNIWLYIFLALLIAAVCSFITYCLYYDPFSFSTPILLWMLRAIIYILFGWWLLRIADKKNIPQIGWLAVVTPIIAILTITTDITAEGLLKNLTYKKIMCFSCFIVVLIWVFSILLTKSKTLLGFLIILNILISIFIILPYGIPRFEISTQGGFSVPSINLSCYPYYTLHNYRPFIHQDNGSLSFLLDIRTLSTLLFFGYEIILSVFQSTKIKFVDKLEEGIKKTENPIIQFLLAGRYFLWNIIRRFIFFTKNFWSVLKANFWSQIKKSLESYIYSLLLIFSFSVPFVIFRLSSVIYEYDKTINIVLLSFSHIIILFALTFLILFPLFLVKLLKSKLFPFRFHNFTPSERPALFLPIYITLSAIGLASVTSYFLEKTYGIYLILFLIAVLYVILWGIIDYIKTDKETK